MDSFGGNSYYQILGVHFDATEEEIRKAYFSIVKKLHPDRRRPGNNGGETMDRFHQVQHANRCLSDSTRRLLYDLRNFGRSSLDASAGVDAEGRPTAEARLIAMQKDQALLDVRNMEVILAEALRKEKKARGVLIQIALYGDLRLRDDCVESGKSGQRTIEPEDLVGPFIDVTVPLQCLVEQHTIVLPGGASASKADLPGFYNPAPLDLEVEHSLYVLYEFRGALHEVIVSDRETLSLPRRKQEVPVGKPPRGPFSPANVSMLRRNVAVSPVAPSKTPSTNDVSRRSRALTGSVETTSRDALEKAVSAYRIQALHARSPDEATPSEFAAVILATGIALGFAVLLAGRNGRP